MAEHRFRTIRKSSTAKLTEKNSRFYGFVFPVKTSEDIENRLNEIRDLHSKASHHCYAWRLGTTGNEFRANDDGEPSGSAGRPILGQIDSFSVTNVLVIVVRYYGGVNLGVSGLIQAYKGAARLALENANIHVVEVTTQHRCKIAYDKVNEFRSWLSETSAEVVSEEYLDTLATFILKFPTSRAGELTKTIEQFTIE